MAVDLPVVSLTPLLLALVFRLEMFCRRLYPGQADVPSHVITRPVETFNRPVEQGTEPTW